MFLFRSPAETPLIRTDYTADEVLRVMHGARIVSLSGSCDLEWYRKGEKEARQEVENKWKNRRPAAAACILSKDSINKRNVFIVVVHVLIIGPLAGREDQ